MSFSFTKMHCDGNDFIVLETFTQEIYDLFTLSLILTDRRCGIGADALLEISPSEVADAALRVYAPDGTSCEPSGCAVRCAVKLLHDQKICEKDQILVETECGILKASVAVSRRHSVTAVCEELPLPSYIDGADDAIVFEGKGQTYRIYPIGQGGEHCVLIFEENFAGLHSPEDVNLAAVASELNHTERFGKYHTVIVQQEGDGTVKMRMWIPGTGEARGNARGAAAGIAALVRSGNFAEDREVRVVTRGDEMTASVKDGTLFLTGKVKAVYDGVSLL